MLCHMNVIVLPWCQDNLGVFRMMCSNTWINQHQGIFSCPQAWLWRFTENLCTIDFFQRTPLENELYVFMMASAARRYMVAFGDTWNFLGTEDITSRYISNPWPAEDYRKHKEFMPGFVCSIGWRLSLNSWGMRLHNSSVTAFWDQWIVQEHFWSVV